MTITYTYITEESTPPNPYDVTYDTEFTFDSTACYAQFWPKKERIAPVCRLILLLDQSVKADVAREFVRWAREARMDVRLVHLTNAHMRGRRGGWDDDEADAPMGEKIKNDRIYLELQWYGTDSIAAVFTMLCLMRILSSEYVPTRTYPLRADITSIFSYKSKVFSPDNHFPVEYDYGNGRTLDSGENLGTIVYGFYTRWFMETDFSIMPKMSSAVDYHRSGIPTETFVAYGRAWLSDNDKIHAYRALVVAIIAKQQKERNKDNEPAAAHARIANGGDGPGDRNNRAEARKANAKRNPPQPIRAADARVLRAGRKRPVKA